MKHEAMLLIVVVGIDKCQHCIILIYLKIVTITPLQNKNLMRKEISEIKQTVNL